MCVQICYYYTFRIEFDRDKLKFVYETIQHVYLCGMISKENKVLQNVNKLANDVCTCTA